MDVLGKKGPEEFSSCVHLYWERDGNFHHIIKRILNSESIKGSCLFKKKKSPFSTFFFPLPSITKYIFLKDPVCGLAHTQRKNGNRSFMKQHFL